MKNNNSKRIGVRKYHKSEQPRLRWTPELHQYFVQTVESLGGKDSMFFFMIIMFYIGFANNLFDDPFNQEISYILL